MRASGIRLCAEPLPCIGCCYPERGPHQLRWTTVTWARTAMQEGQGPCSIWSRAIRITKCHPPVVRCNSRHAPFDMRGGEEEEVFHKGG